MNALGQILSWHNLSQIRLSELLGSDGKYSFHIPVNRFISVNKLKHITVLQFLNLYITTTAIVIFIVFFSQSTLRERYYMYSKTVEKFCQSKHASLIESTESKGRVIARKRSSLGDCFGFGFSSLCPVSTFLGQPLSVGACQSRACALFPGSCWLSWTLSLKRSSLQVMEVFHRCPSVIPALVRKTFEVFPLKQTVWLIDGSYNSASLQEVNLNFSR